MRPLPRRRLLVEGLENRRLLAGDVSLEGNVLTIDGSNKSDRINISVENTDLIVTLNKKDFTFAASDVTSIVIDGSKGNDWISIDGSLTVGAAIDGGAGNDRITGGGGDDTILGDRGNDRLQGGGGNDTVNAGAGNDWVWGGDGDDIVHGDAGHDHLFGDAGFDQLFGDAGHDALQGGADDDLLDGGAGHDRLRGGDGNDQLFGQEGKDQLYGELGDDLLDGGGDNDKLWGGEGNDVIKGGTGADHLNGGGGDDLLDGDEGKNHFRDGFVVDLDEQLVAPLTRSDTLAPAGEARLTQVVVSGAVQVQFQVSVTGAAPNETLNISVDGVPVGQLTTDGAGAGSASFDPSTLAAVVDEGSLIEVGPDSTLVVISGTLAKRFA
jgi:Ca2+-binding RTX toxin-like protein